MKISIYRETTFSSINAQSRILEISYFWEKISVEGKVFATMLSLFCIITTLLKVVHRKLEGKLS